MLKRRWESLQRREPLRFASDSIHKEVNPKPDARFVAIIHKIGGPHFEKGE